MNLPAEFEARMRLLLGAEYDAFFETLSNEPEAKGLRVNLAKTTVEAFSAEAPFPLEPLSHVKEGFLLPCGVEAGKHPYHAAGAYYMQDPGAMSAVAVLPEELLEKPHLRVLDLCSAPGGKTTQIAARIRKNGGFVVANEYNAARSRILLGNVERMGLDNVIVTNIDTVHFGEWYPDYFDVVIADAPCSGEGMFRKNDRAIEEWNEGNVLMCAKRQREILDNAARCVRPGGYLLYSTCTYSMEENEMTVADFLSRHGAFSLRPCSEAVSDVTADGVTPAGCDVENLFFCRRFYPHRARGEGQFAALMQRADQDIMAAPPRKKKGEKGTKTPPRASLSDAEKRILNRFFADTLASDAPKGLLLCGGNVSVFPPAAREEIVLPPFGLLSAGATVGEIRKDRVIPHHHFFMAYGAEMKRRLVLCAGDEALSRYLAGEEIEAPDGAEGYTAVLIALSSGAVTLGGGKAAMGRLKNHYPKGLRVR